MNVLIGRRIQQPLSLGVYQVPFGTVDIMGINRLVVFLGTVERQWLEHLCNHENMLETGVLRATEC